jgi:enoyl-CoA hydratase/carnithine racemase
MAAPDDALSLAGGALTVTRAGPVATVALNRPEARNALTRAMWQALPPLAADLAADPSVRAVILRGAGERAFSGGADIAEFPEVYATAEAARAYNDDVRAGQDAVARMPKPVIAAVLGACVGGGCGLAIACDLRFAGAGARFAIPPARLGAAYSFADVKQLVELVGPARAKDMLFSGRMVPADEAWRIGLADRAVPDAEVIAAAESYAAGIAELSAASLEAAKRMVQAVRDGVADETPELRRLFDDTFAGPDFAEGYAAFLEKRRPRFR